MIGDTRFPDHRGFPTLRDCGKDVRHVVLQKLCGSPIPCESEGFDSGHRVPTARIKLVAPRMKDIRGAERDDSLPKESVKELVILSTTQATSSHVESARTLFFEFSIVSAMHITATILGGR